MGIIKKVFGGIFLFFGILAMLSVLLTPMLSSSGGAELLGEIMGQLIIAVLLIYLGWRWVKKI